jgi:hypothetical protein
MPTETCTAETSHPPTMEGPMSTTPQPLRPGEHPAWICAPRSPLPALVKQKRLAKNAPVHCVVHDTATEILAEEDSLAENIQRAPLDPLDQFRAFLSLRAKELSDEEIAAAFFASVTARSLRAGRRRLEDVALLDGLVAAEGWKWVEVATEFPYGSKPKDGGGGQTRKRAERFFVNGFRG